MGCSSSSPDIGQNLDTCKPTESPPQTNHNQSANPSEVSDVNDGSGNLDDDTSVNPTATTNPGPADGPHVNPAATINPGPADGAASSLAETDTTSSDPTPATNEAEKRTSLAEEDPITCQEKLSSTLHTACLLIKPKTIYDRVNQHVRKLHLSRALPHTVSITRLLSSFINLQEVDISGNNIGPQGFRAVMLAMSHNSTILKLNVANNKTDIDSAESVGKMLACNRTLQWLDISGNNLGRDFLSRCVGPALKTNSSLRCLILESCGSVDVNALLEGLKSNLTLQEINFNHNQMTNGVQFAEKLAEILQSSSCPLLRLHVKNCGLDGTSVQHLTKALAANTSLVELNVSGLQGSTMTEMMKFITQVACHPALQSLVMDDISTTENVCSYDTIEDVSGVSSMKSLSLANCKLTDEMLCGFAKKCQGKLQNLTDVNLTNNPGLTAASLSSIQMLASDDSGSISIEKLNVGMTSMEDVSTGLNSDWSKFNYLNLRKAKLSTVGLSKLRSLLHTLHIKTLVLDGIKLSGSTALTDILGGTPNSLVALSLGSCQLNDRDLKQLTTALPRIRLHMLKLSANRITDTGLSDLVSDLLSLDTHPLELVDLSDNKITDTGAEKMHQLYTSPKFKCNIHTFNISNNAIGIKGLKLLVSLVKKTGLTSLQLSQQKYSFDEEDIEDVLFEMAQTLGLQIDKQDVESGTAIGKSGMPDMPPGLMIKLTGLGGHSGPVSQLLDSVSIQTDYRTKQICHMTFDHTLQLAAKLQAHDSENMLLSQKEWDQLIGVDKGAPSWLQVQSHREKAVYISNLPAAITTQKMEAILENEADCNVKEVCLMKDIVLKKNNGLAWVLMADEASVQRARELFLQGQAQVFGQPFVISRVNVEVNDGASQQAESKAQSDLARREAERQKEEAAHRTLIQQSYQESQERHAYRLAHPAYADGRIW